MPVNLSIKNTPDQVAERLRQRAARNRRSLQGELLAIVEAAVRDEVAARPIAILTEVRRLGLTTPDEAAEIVRLARDGR